MPDAVDTYSPHERDLFCALIGRQVEYLVVSGFSEVQALNVLEATLSPSMVYQRFKSWSPSHRADMIAALENEHPKGGLASIIQRAHDAAEIRVARITPKTDGGVDAGNG